nr:DUF1870 family protein [Actinopolymorpha alba]
MTPVGLRVLREPLGLTEDWLAAYLCVNRRTVRAWERGHAPIPGSVRIAIEDLTQRTAAFIAEYVQQLSRVPEPNIVTFHDDADFHLARWARRWSSHPTIPFPASWHRAAVARIARRVPRLTITYADAKRVISTGSLAYIEDPESASADN